MDSTLNDPVDIDLSHEHTAAEGASAEGRGSERLGISGRIARTFLLTEITPLLALVGLLLGLFAVLVTPREEDPQINVTFANVFIPFPGASASEVEQLVSTPAEQVLSEIKGIKHIYSVSRPGMSVLTVQYRVGEDRSEALVRLYNQVMSNMDWLPQDLGVGQPLIKPRGIDDVPIVSLTLWSPQADKPALELAEVAHTLESELKRITGSRNIYTIGAPERVVHVLLDPARLASYGLSLPDLSHALQLSGTAHDAVSLVDDNHEIQVVAGELLSSAEEIADLVVGVHNERPVYLRDVATVRLDADAPESYVRFGTAGSAPHIGLDPALDASAVTIAIAKKPGTNAVELADKVIARVGQLENTLIPDDVEVTVTRNYGATADAKSQKLIQKLVIETIAVVFLILVALGWRESFIVGAAVIITLAVTLFASWAYGFTLNRVSLFALIFSIGILVDDAIVVVENIHRHMQLGAKNLIAAIPRAVDEVGGPTILATFTVIAALMPMAFVTGLMGPYMSPIPINASMGMLISLAVAYVVTPWMTAKVMRGEHFHAHGESNDKPGRTRRFYERLIGPFLHDRHGGWRRFLLFAAVALLIAASVSLAAMKLVVLKMLPFDNKSEVQVVLDMPEGTTLEQTARVLDAIAERVSEVPEVTDYQIYAGTSAPINFNGLVRQYYLREGANLGDVQVNLVDKHYRDRQSHDIALDLRERLADLQTEYNASIKVVEVPPGPPVLAPLVAEVYGMDHDGQLAVAEDVRKQFEQAADIVDIDTTIEAPQERLVIQVDRARAARIGVSQADITQAISTALGGQDIAYLHRDRFKYAVPVRLELPSASKDDIDTVLAIRVKSRSGTLVPLSELVSIETSTRQQSIHHKDLLPVVYVMGDMAGETDSPLYGMAEIFSGIRNAPVERYGAPIGQHFVNPPEDPYFYSVKWDGEWQVTYDTFRDMGIAYAFGMVLVYLLVVGQFRSYAVPLIIMAPIPLTVIGVMPGHALLGSQFTATSMIGMIALAGIIVRNSILLVDFINEQLREGVALKEAIINSSTVRTKPIILTALAAMVGAFFILDDPVFGGLAVSLIFGILVSTLLTLVLIPILYYLYLRKRVHRMFPQQAARQAA
ncbi:MAG: multidrug transporter AcrB [Gammaproteobacteria bacterium]|nr:MAG: multidrug transporter AcrB [Gammaproteobacteria bacterium]PIE35561.1 MAG: multidrug transporter AcrB [Gammaproteobacteria bacterium]